MADHHLPHCCCLFTPQLNIGCIGQVRCVAVCMGNKATLTKGHVCFLVQINTASVSPAVSPLRIPACLPGLPLPESHSLLLRTNALILVPVSAYWWCFTKGIGRSPTEVGLDQLMLISVYYRVRHCQGSRFANSFQIHPGDLSKSETISMHRCQRSGPFSLLSPLCKHKIPLADHLFNRTEGLTRLRAAESKGCPAY